MLCVNICKYYKNKSIILLGGIACLLRKCKHCGNVFTDCILGENDMKCVNGMATKTDAVLIVFRVLKM